MDTPHHLKLLTLLLLSILSPTLAEIKNTHIFSDARPMILFEQFGFLRGGRLSVSISNVHWSPAFAATSTSNFNTSLSGFFLIPNAFYPLIINESDYTPHFCPLSSHYTIHVLTFSDLTTNRSCERALSIDMPDEYSLLFGNCQPMFDVTMDVRTELYNVDAGGGKDYLPLGRRPVPKLYFGFFLVYLLFFLVWVWVCCKQRNTLEKIHLVMGGLLLFKALKLVCAAEDLWHVKRTGSPHGWDVAFYIFGFFKGILLFTVIVLIGTGWSFLKPYLQEREKKILMIVIPMQVIENIAAVVIGETGPAEPDFLTWNQIFLTVDIICCAAVFFPIIWSIKNLREASKTDGKAARNLEKLTLFKQFYVVVVSYLYFTRIFLSAFVAMLSYKYRWAVTAAEEGASLAFYLFVFYNFQPVEKNPYLYIGEEEEAAARGALEMEDSFEL
ncbi:hypothetical protein J5N97_001542 [Dioscorea zingiberensis]|uniref:Uncharacterized protein n=1 Tax=Dioscorea zingiberensis TaxID=325984 RepID=A0A9D5BVT3_9LILI|nr:hypothetical protein J5N97_001542 [Dioscorea zingiberensis]